MLLVFSDDWGRHPSSCQHLVRRLLPRHRVTWVNTIGMRPPTLSRATLERAWEKLRHWSPQEAASSATPANPTVLSPRMWPWFRRRHDRWLNRQLLVRGLNEHLAQAGEPVYAITTIPIVADLLDQLHVDRWLYYCVDDFSTWPGLDQATMAVMERKLLQGCDRVVAVSDRLVQHVENHRRTAELLTHGVDLSFWQRPASTDIAQRLAHLPRPWIVFWGVVDQRMNAAWIKQLAGDLTAGTIVLVGPKDNPAPELLATKRVAYLPPLAHEQLPELGQLADVLIMPYADLPVTRAMQPLKLKEYLATGKPVVASDLPAVREWSDCLDVATNADDFSRLVRSRIEQGLPTEQHRARQRLDQESWDEKARQFEAMLLDVPAPLAEVA